MVGGCVVVVGVVVVGVVVVGVVVVGGCVVVVGAVLVGVVVVGVVVVGVVVVGVVVVGVVVVGVVVVGCWVVVVGVLVVGDVVVVGLSPPQAESSSTAAITTAMNSRDSVFLMFPSLAGRRFNPGLYSIYLSLNLSVALVNNTLVSDVAP